MTLSNSKSTKSNRSNHRTPNQDMARPMVENLETRMMFGGGNCACTGGVTGYVPPPTAPVYFYGTALGAGNNWAG